MAGKSSGPIPPPHLYGCGGITPLSPPLAYQARSEGNVLPNGTRRPSRTNHSLRPADHLHEGTQSGRELQMACLSSCVPRPSTPRHTSRPPTLAVTVPAYTLLICISPGTLNRTMATLRDLAVRYAKQALRTDLETSNPCKTHNVRTQLRAYISAIKSSAGSPSANRALAPLREQYRTAGVKFIATRPPWYRPSGNTGARSSRHDKPNQISSVAGRENNKPLLTPSHALPHKREVERRQTVKALDHSPNSAPGMDGLPFAAWRKLREFSADLFKEVLHSLTETDAWREVNRLYAQSWVYWNIGYLVCLPKRTASQDPVAGAYHSAENTRPISILICKTRSIAAAVRQACEPVINPTIHSSQTGFLWGWQMLSNIIDVDETGLATVALCPGHAQIFFDFKAAFLSVNHTFLQDAMRLRGLPPQWACYLQHLNRDIGCIFCIGGSTQPGFQFTAGIRQGCPLSPLLFAAAIDFFVRRLIVLCGPAGVRTFADDLAVTLQHAFSAAPTLAREFDDLERTRGLRLNLPKAVFLPLWPSEKDAVRNTLEEAVPAWKGIQVAFSARYLGFILGPERRTSQWNSTEEKILTGAQIGPVGKGAYLTTLVYRIYIQSSAGFQIKFVPLPDKWNQTEIELIGILLPGPQMASTDCCTPPPNLIHATPMARLRRLNSESQHDLMSSVNPSPSQGQCPTRPMELFLHPWNNLDMESMVRRRIQLPFLLCGVPSGDSGYHSPHHPC